MHKQLSLTPQCKQSLPVSRGNIAARLMIFRHNWFSKSLKVQKVLFFQHVPNNRRRISVEDNIRFVRPHRDRKITSFLPTSLNRSTKSFFVQKIFDFFSYPQLGTEKEEIRLYGFKSFHKITNFTLLYLWMWRVSIIQVYSIMIERQRISVVF